MPEQPEYPDILHTNTIKIENPTNSLFRNGYADCLQCRKNI
jgi:hypothetical protein